MTQAYPIPTVGALIVNPLNEVLVLKTHKWHHKYGLPGGKIEVGETLEQALVREIKEETNLIVQDIQFLIFQEVVFSEEFYKPMHFIFFNYSCKVVDSTGLKLNDEAQEFLWVEPEDALNLPLNTPTRVLIESYLLQNNS